MEAVAQVVFKALDGDRWSDRDREALARFAVLCGEKVERALLFANANQHFLSDEYLSVYERLGTLPECSKEVNFYFHSSLNVLAGVKAAGSPLELLAQIENDHHVKRHLQEGHYGADWLMRGLDANQKSKIRELAATHKHKDSHPTSDPAKRSKKPFEELMKDMESKECPPPNKTVESTTKMVVMAVGLLFVLRVVSLMLMMARDEAQVGKVGHVPPVDSARSRLRVESSTLPDVRDLSVEEDDAHNEL